MLNFGNKEFRNLQEQVLKNAQDIETLKGRENLQIVIVEELPEVGNPDYIYLVAKDDGESPDVYDEYIWLEDEERYEKIGGVSIDLSNYVTLDSAQTITGTKTFESFYVTGGVYYKYDNADDWYIYRESNYNLSLKYGNNIIYTFQSGAFLPRQASVNLGSSSLTWRDLYLSNSINLRDQAATPHIWELKPIGNYYLGFLCNTSSVFYFNPNGTVFTRTIEPSGDNLYNLGNPGAYWKALYLAGNITDGVNTVSVANIASKVTSTFISGSFDSNGESTIDTEQTGTPEGLFIFTYGNCQCFLRLTATMVQNADTTPIRVACPMIYNSGTVNGWLNITKSGYILILKITDGTNHVDSGYSWTLTKTNLL